MDKKVITSVLELSEEEQKIIIKQYEYVRKSGLTNMFDTSNVNDIAKHFEFKELVIVTKDSKVYSSILKNYSNLIKKYL
jgi:hypothetical protein